MLRSMQVVDTIFWCLLVMLCLPCLCLRRLTLTLSFSCRILSHVRIPPSLPRLSWEAAKLSLHGQIARYFTAGCCMCGTFKHLSKVGDLESVDIKQESIYSTYIHTYSTLHWRRIPTSVQVGMRRRKEKEGCG